MEEIYSVEGTLNRGFVGQITYMVCLEKTYTKLDIAFSFDKRKYSEDEVTPKLIEETRRLVLDKYGKAQTEQETRSLILGDMKTEIHTLATLNDEFIGCVHRQLLTRHMLYDGEYASEGCIPQDKFEGVLKVTVLVFNVIKNGTPYRLSVSGE